MRLIFDGDAEQYHPGTGVNLIPGEAEYADDKAEQLLAAGLKRPKAKPAPKEKE